MIICTSYYLPLGSLVPLLVMLKLISGFRCCQPDLSVIKFLINLLSNGFSSHYWSLIISLGDYNFVTFYICPTFFFNLEFFQRRTSLHELLDINAKNGWRKGGKNTCFFYLPNFRIISWYGGDQCFIWSLEFSYICVSVYYRY